jgi:hypothetical protein
MGDRSTKAMLRWAQDRLAGLPEEDNGGELSESTLSSLLSSLLWISIDLPISSPFI